MQPKKSLDIRDDKSVMEALKNDRDGKVFEIVYRHYYKPLCAYAMQSLSREDAEEVVQSTMLWLWDSRETIVPVSLKSLLFTIVKNKVIDKASKARLVDRVHRMLAQKHQAAFDDPDIYFETELYNLFAQALKKLPKKYRTTFEMSRFDGKTHIEIAQELNVSKQTVNYRIGKSIEILREELKDYLPIFMLLLGRDFWHHV